MKYQNNRDSLVAIGKLTIAPKKIADLPDAIASVLEEKRDGKLVHPYRRGKNPTLTPIERTREDSLAEALAEIATCTDPTRLEYMYNQIPEQSVRDAILARNAVLHSGK